MVVDWPHAQVTIVTRLAFFQSRERNVVAAARLTMELRGSVFEKKSVAFLTKTSSRNMANILFLISIQASE